MEVYEERPGFYTLSLDDEDLDYILDLESQGAISPYTKSGIRFRLFPHFSDCSKAFELLSSDPKGDKSPVSDPRCYFAYIDTFGLRNKSDLLRVIGKMGTMSIERPSPIGGPLPINEGYVRFKLPD